MTSEQEPFARRVDILEQEPFGKAGSYMQIIVLKSPKFLSGVLRALFGIRKEN